MSVTKTEGGRWRARVYSSGRQIATATFDRKGDAEAWEREQKQSLRTHTWVDPKQGKVAFSKVIEDFNTFREGTVARHTFDTDEANLRLHVPRALAMRPIASIRASDFEDLYSVMLRDRARGTVRRFRDALVAVGRYAMDRGLVAENAAQRSKVPHGRGDTSDPVRPLTSAELNRLIDCARETYAGYANLVEFAFLTGARWGELAELRVKDVVDRDTKCLLISRSRSDGYQVKTTKSRRERLVPLTARAQTVLAEQCAGKSDEDLIFLSPRGKRLNRGNFERAIGWKAASSGHRFHDLRHTAATRWIRLGIDVKTVSVWLGHSDSAITHRTYVGWLTDDATASALDKLERAAEIGE